MDLRPGDHTDGRRSVLTPEIQAAIVQVLQRGGTYEQAAAAGGIALRTLYSWVQKGTRRRKGDRNGEYHPLAVAARQAAVQARRTAAAERRTREAEEQERATTQPARPTQPSKLRSAESERMHFAKMVRRALHPPLPGTPEARTFEAEYAQTRAHLGITGSSDAVDANDEEEDEAEQERLLALWLRIHERQAHNAAILRGVAELRAPRYMVPEPRLPRDDRRDDQEQDHELDEQE